MVSLFRNNKSLFVIALIAVVNALGYGIIIPILYAYSQQYGLNDFQNGMLFATFSACQFVSTPFIGRLSDVYGRKPLLIFSLVGTLLSFVMMAFAPSAIFLFLARALDGLSSGNIPVAAAVISDTTEPKDRAKGFGIIGASFGFGFIFGPAISALTVGFGLHWPFIIAAAITAIAVVLTWVMLPETNQHIGRAQEGKVFDLVKLGKMLAAPNVGKTLIISLVYSIAFSLFIFAFQPFSVKVLNLSAKEISVMYTIFGVIGLLSQAMLVPNISKWRDEKQTLTIGLLTASVAFFAMYLTNSLPIFIAVSVLLSFGNALVTPMIQALLSKEALPHEQGAIQGINASYMSIGFVIGPVLGGLLATYYLQLPFIAGSVLALICFAFSFGVVRRIRTATNR